MLRINEIFKSVQGEGYFSGTPCIFIRLQGCNVGCEFCDTKHAQSQKNGTLMHIEEVIRNTLNLCNNTKIKHVVITGGEPFLQAEALRRLCQQLHNNDFNISIESSGTVKIDEHIEAIFEGDIDNKPEDKSNYRIYLTVSPKYTPPLDEYLFRADEIKILIGNEEGKEPPIPDLVIRMLTERTSKQMKNFYFQPIWNENKNSDDREEDAYIIWNNMLACHRAIALCFHYGACLSIQLQKCIGIR